MKLFLLRLNAFFFGADLLLYLYTKQAAYIFASILALVAIWLIYKGEL